MNNENGSNELFSETMPAASAAKEIEHLLKEDGVHFTIEGYKILADKILEGIDL